MSSVPDQGQLGETSIATLLLELLGSRFTGSLELRHGKVTKRVLLREGLPLLAESTRPSESLGALLQGSGRISAEQQQQLSRQVRTHRKRELEAALQLRLLAPRELLVAVSQHVRRCLVEVFGWSGGEFALIPTEAAAGALPGLGVDPLPLVQEGIESHWSPERILREFGEKSGHVVARTRRAAGIAERLRSDSGLERLLEALDGKRTLAEAIHGAASFGALAAAWVLDGAGGLEYREACGNARDPSPVAPSPLEIEVVAAGADGAAAPGSREAGSARKGAEAPEAQDDATRALREEILERYGRLAELDHYALLGLDRNASSGDIKRAYVRAAKRFHPDAVARLGLGDVKPQANEVFARISRAHSTLSNPDSRHEYDASLDGQGEADVERAAQAEMLYRKASVLLKAGKFGEASQLLHSCVALWPEEAVYQCDLGWSLYRKPRPELEPARKALEKAAELDAESALAHYRLSLVLASMGDQAGAAKARAQGVRLDPNVGRR